jgi:uridine kinase
MRACQDGYQRATSITYPGKTIAEMVISDRKSWERSSVIESQRLLKAPARAGKTRVVAIDGRSGAGKTSLAAELRTQIAAPVVSLEDLYGGWDGLELGIDLLVSEVLEPLAAGRAARVPRYDWGTKEWADPRVLEPPEVLIVEGVGAGALRASVYESLLIWLEAAPAVRKKRALDRDGETFAPYWDQWAAQEDAMLAREHTPDRANLIIDGLSGNIVRA